MHERKATMVPENPFEAEPELRRKKALKLKTRRRSKEESQMSKTMKTATPPWARGDYWKQELARAAQALDRHPEVVRAKLALDEAVARVSGTRKVSPRCLRALLQIPD
jgi:hypothetical protein